MASTGTRTAPSTSGARAEPRARRAPPPLPDRGAKGDARREPPAGVWHLPTPVEVRARPPTPLSPRRERAFRFRGLLLALLALLVLAAPARAASIAFVLESGEVLTGRDADRRWHPASLTKLMTAYLTFQELATRRLTLEQELAVSEAAATQPTTSLGVSTERTLTVEQALQGLILRSGNDAAVVLAEAVAGSEAAFVERMNAAAARLGMTSTHYANASGLPDDSQVTTARDLALLARALILDFPQYYHFFGEAGFTFAGDWRGNINGILGALPGADGMKTGFTCKSGYNLVVSALRDGRRVVAVVLGERSPDLRSYEARMLVEEAFETLARDKRQPNQPLAPLDPAIAAGGAPPPAGLLENECGYGVAARLPGWGVVLGAYRSRGKALSVAEATKGRIVAFELGGTAAVPSKLGRKFNAVVVGLSKSEAQRGCKAIRGGGGYCLVLNNDVLNNPLAVWR